MTSLSSRTFRRPIRSWVVPLFAGAVITACSAYYITAMRKPQPAWQALPRAIVRRVSFDACLRESGVARSSQQTVVKCQLESLTIRKRGGAFLAGGASTILEIISNGTTVKKGDVLCTLDASEYQDVAEAQTIRVLQHQAEAVQTDLALQSAEIALREYSEGLFAHDIVGMKGRIALAESDVQVASDRLAWSDRMAAKGYASRAQVANDRQTLLTSTNKLKQAQLELDTYRRYNSTKTIVSLKAEVEKAR
jgi:HlyD family secretion protein